MKAYTKLSWICTCIGVCTCIFITQKIAPMWFFMIPFFLSLAESGSKKKEDEKPGMEAFKNNG